MKITPDYVGRNDEYDDDTIRYYTEVDDDGYFYECYVLLDGKKCRIIINDPGVSIDFPDGGCIHTNIKPEILFPNCRELSWDQICKILKIIEVTDAEGVYSTPEQMEALYEKWKSLGEP